MVARSPFFNLNHFFHLNVLSIFFCLAGDFTQFFMRAAPRIFSETSQIFRASWAQNLLDPDAGRIMLSTLDAMRLRSTLSDVLKHEQRTLAECMHFFLRGACRIIGPNFQNFCKIFARFLRRFCVISTLDSRVILH